MTSELFWIDNNVLSLKEQNESFKELQFNYDEISSRRPERRQIADFTTEKMNNWNLYKPLIP